MATSSASRLGESPTRHPVHPILWSWLSLLLANLLFLGSVNMGIGSLGASLSGDASTTGWDVAFYCLLSGAIVADLIAATFGALAAMAGHWAGLIPAFAATLMAVTVLVIAVS